MAASPSVPRPLALTELRALSPADLGARLRDLPYRSEETLMMIDWGNVLFRINYNLTVQELLGWDIPLKASSGAQHPLMDKLERGEIVDLPTFLVEIKKIRQEHLAATGQPADKPGPTDAQIVAAFNRLFDTAKDGNLGYLYERFPLLEAVAKIPGVTLTGLTNTNAIHAADIMEWSIAQGVYPRSFGVGAGNAAGIFAGGVFPSYELGGRKGEVDAANLFNNVFVRMCLAVGFIPGRAFLLDDSSTYTATMTEAMQGVSKALGVPIAGGGVLLKTFGLEEFDAAVRFSLTAEQGATLPTLATVRAEAEKFRLPVSIADHRRALVPVVDAYRERCGEAAAASIWAKVETGFAHMQARGVAGFSGDVNPPKVAAAPSKLDAIGGGGSDSLGSFALTPSGAAGGASSHAPGPLSLAFGIDTVDGSSPDRGRDSREAEAAAAPAPGGSAV